MKSLNPDISMAKICGWFGITRQAYYAHHTQTRVRDLSEQVVVKMVQEVRKKHRRMGGRKLYEKLSPLFEKHQIKMGRDALFDLLHARKLLIKPRKNRPKTTDSEHGYRIYPNHIKEFVPRAPNQLWVTDMTYWKVGKRFLYISLITDAYSHYIVGYHIANDLKAVGPLAALAMALNLRDQYPLAQEQPLIHHSDRGVQYCSHAYTGRLKSEGILISMAAKGEPLENPIAERINGILKHEYLFEFNPQNETQAQKILKRSIHWYNTDRPHESLDMLTPIKLHNEPLEQPPKKRWKNYYQPKTKQV